jgi:hypothetical protein
LPILRAKARGLGCPFGSPVIVNASVLILRSSIPER